MKRECESCESDHTRMVAMASVGQWTRMRADCIWGRKIIYPGHLIEGQENSKEMS